MSLPLLYADGESVSLVDMRIGTPCAMPTVPQLKRLEQAIRENCEPVVTEPQHFFANGIYGRVLPIPAGTVMVGKTHRHEHLVMLIKGEVSINTERGMERITAPHVWVSPVGAKRALLTHTDCEFMTVHLNPDNTKDMDALEAEIIVPESLEHQPGEFAAELQRIYA